MRRTAPTCCAYKCTHFLALMACCRRDGATVVHAFSFNFPPCHLQFEHVCVRVSTPHGEESLRWVYKLQL